MQNIVSLPVSALKRAGGAVSSSLSGVTKHLPGLRRRGSADPADPQDIDDEFIMKNCLEKLNLALKSTPSKDAATTMALSVKSGFLMKRNEQGHYHKVMACVVPHWFLYYFDSETADSPKGCIDLHFYMKMMIEGGNVLKLSADTMTDGTPGQLRSYYFMDDDQNVLREWINCIHRERYQIVRDERDAYQQLQDHFSGEMASATMEIQESTIDKERLQLEVAHSRLAADDSLVAMQRVLVVIGTDEEKMRGLNTAPKASDAIIASIKRSREQHERALYDLEQRRVAERRKYEEHVEMLEKQLSFEKGNRERAESKMLAEQREFEQTVNREIRETLGKLDKANLNLQMAVAARSAADDKLVVLAEQKKMLVKEVKSLRGRLQQANDTVENLMALNERTSGIYPNNPGNLAFSGIALPTTSASADVLPGKGLFAGSDSTSTSRVDDLTGAVMEKAGKLPGIQLNLDDYEETGIENDDCVDSEQGRDSDERQSWAMSASALKELGWLSPEQRQLVESRVADGPDISMKPGADLGALGPGSSFPGKSTPPLVGRASEGGALPLPPTLGSQTSTGFSIGQFLSGKKSEQPLTSQGSGEKEKRSSMTQLLGSLLMGSSSSSTSSAPFQGEATSVPEKATNPTSLGNKTSENTVQAKTKVQSFFSSPLAEPIDGDTSDRAPASLRLTCLRCQGSVEGPKYSTCTCSVPALNNDETNIPSSSSYFSMFRRTNNTLRGVEPLVPQEDHDSVAL